MTKFEEEIHKVLSSKGDLSKKITPKVIETLLDLLDDHNCLDQTFVLGVRELFEERLWPQFGIKSTDNETQLISILITFIIGRGYSLTFESQEKLLMLLTRLNQFLEKKTTDYKRKSLVVNTLGALASNIRDPITRKSLAPMFSILTWKNVTFEKVISSSKDEMKSAFDREFEEYNRLSGREKITTHLLFSWVGNLIITFKELPQTNDKELNMFAADILNFVSTVLSQLPTRRFLKTLIDQGGLLIAAQRRVNASVAIWNSVESLKYFLNFPIDEFTGEEITFKLLQERHAARVNQFLAVCFRKHDKELVNLLEATSTQLQERSFLTTELKKITSGSLDELLMDIGITTIDGTSFESKIDSVMAYIAPPLDIHANLKLESVYPDENTLSKVKQSNHSVGIRLGPQYLSINDLINRSYKLRKLDSFGAISEHVERTIARFEKRKNQSKLNGNSRHGVKIKDVKFQQSNGDLSSGFKQKVGASVKVELGTSPDIAVPEWNGLSEGDIVFFAELMEKDKSAPGLKSHGLKYLRSGVINGIYNNNNAKKTSTNSKNFNLTVSFPGSHDIKQLRDIDFNILIKLPSDLKNYHVPLQSIVGLKTIQEECNTGEAESQLPEWLVDVLLGYDDIAAAAPSISSSQGHTCKFPDGNVSLGSLKEAYPELMVQVGENLNKKRKLDDNSILETDDQTVIIDSITFEDGKLLVKPFDGNVSSLVLSGPQVRALVDSNFPGLHLIDGLNGAGKSLVIKEIIKNHNRSQSSQKLLVISKTKSGLDKVLGHNDSNSITNLSDHQGLILSLERTRAELVSLLQKVDQFAFKLGVDGAYGNDPETAESFFRYHIVPKWTSFSERLKLLETSDAVLELYPFAALDFKSTEGSSLQQTREAIVSHYTSIWAVFERIHGLRGLSYFKSESESTDYLLKSSAKVVGITTDDLMKQPAKFKDLRLSFGSIIFTEAEKLKDYEVLFPILHFATNEPSVLLDGQTLGDNNHPQSQVGSVNNSDLSLIRRLIEQKVPYQQLRYLHNRSKRVTDLLSSFVNITIDKSAMDGVMMLLRSEGDETENIPGFYQNVKEGEAVIEFYRKLVADGKQTGSIAILTPSLGQELLLKDIAKAKLDHTPKISTSTSFAGQDSDIVIYSFTRTAPDQTIDTNQLFAAVAATKSEFYAFASLLTITALKASKLVPSLVETLN